MAEPLALGTLVASRYRIESVLAEGGMGAVYVARDERMRERVALVPPEQFEDVKHVPGRSRWIR